METVAVRKWTWRRFWPVVVLALAAVAVVIVHVAVERYTQEPQNYSRIEDGLWLGGSVEKPPLGEGWLW